MGGSLSGVETAKSRILSHCAALRCAVDELEGRLLCEVDAVASARASAVEDQMRALRESLSQLQRCSDGIRCVSVCSDAEVCLSFSSLQAELTALNSSRGSPDVLDDGVIPVSVQEVSGLSELRGSVVVGGPASCAHVEVVPEDWSVSVRSVETAVSYRVDLYESGGMVQWVWVWVCS